VHVVHVRIDLDIRCPRYDLASQSMSPVSDEPAQQQVGAFASILKGIKRQQ